MNVIRLRNEDKKYLYYKVVIVGAGGVGSVFIRNFLQDCRMYLNAEQRSINPTFRRNIDITLIDGDKVEEKNLNNQIFVQEDIGEYKVDVLADRYGDVYELDVKRVTEYVKTLDMLKRLFHYEPDEKVQPLSILVGMVDNNRTRQLFDQFFYDESVRDLIYIDVGCEGIYVPNDPRHPTEEEIERVENSGFSGQVVCGLKVDGQEILKPVGRVYRNILEDTRTAFPGESCGELIVNNPQRSATQRLAATIANGYMNNLLHTQSIFTHYTNFDARLGGARPTYF
jgi:hypothetical protein